ncbi:MAG TPA: response regulator [Parafilimonas sp.]|nr:response regulator [Parafilimonas sp.]
MKHKIMLVDDAEIANIIMKKIISFLMLNVDVFDFTNPDEAYEEMKTLNPDLIFLDLNMPWLNGWDYLEKMKKENYNFKVIIVTSSTSYVDKERVVEFPNVIDYLEKPVSKEQILKHINALSEDHNYADLEH